MDMFKDDETEAQSGESLPCVSHKWTLKIKMN